MLADTKQRARHRAKIIRGQVEALLQAIEHEEYCTTLLNQSRSVQKSLQSLDALILEHHLHTHVREQLADAKQRPRAVRELIAVFNQAQK